MLARGLVTSGTTKAHTQPDQGATDKTCGYLLLHNGETLIAFEETTEVPYYLAADGDIVD